MFTTNLLIKSVYRIFPCLSFIYLHTAIHPSVYPFSNDKLQTSKQKEFAANNFKFDENGRKFSKWVENIVGKGKIARFEQFLLFPLCFQKTRTADT